MQQIRIITTVRIADENDDYLAYGETTVDIAIADSYKGVSAFPLTSLGQLFGSLLVATAEDYVAKKAEAAE